MNFGLAKSQALNICTFGVVRLKHGLIGHMKERWTQEQLAAILLVMLNIRNVVFEEVEFGKEENIRKVVFEEKPVIDSAQVLIPIAVKETNLVIENNVQTIVDDIVQEQENDEVLPQIPIQQPQQPPEVSLRRSDRERKSAIPNDYIIFLQEHKDDSGLKEDG